LSIVNRLNKTESFKDLKVLAFDLRTAAISYAPGFNCSITYTPEIDSYEVLFFRDDEGKSNPHALIAPLLSHRLNELTSAGVTERKKNSVGIDFIGVSET